MKKKNSKIILLVVILFVVLVNVVLCTVSYLKIGTINYPSAVKSMLELRSDECEYSVVSEEPQIILADADNAMDIFKRYLDENGYKINGQTGGSFIISKDGKEENVTFSVNSFFSIWKWS